MGKTNVYISFLVLGFVALTWIVVSTLVSEGEPVNTNQDEAPKRDSVAAAFSPESSNKGTKPASDDPILRTELHDLLVELGIAFGSGDLDRIENSFSLEQLFTHCDLSGMIDWRGMPDTQRTQYRQRFIKGVQNTLPTSLSTNKFSAPKILRIEAVSEQEAIVYASVHLDLVSSTSKLRFWTRKDADLGWQIYDFEDLEYGLRLSILIGMAITPTGPPPEWVKDFALLAGALQTWINDFGEEASEEILVSAEKLLELKLPPDIEAFTHTIRSTALLYQGDTATALEAIEKAEKLNPGSAGLVFQRGECYLWAGEYTQAISQFEKYVELLGWDPDVHHSLALCYANLGEPEKSLNHSRRGLEENPQSFRCLSSLALALPPEKLPNEISTRLKLFEDKELAYEALLDGAIEEGREDLCPVLMAMFKKDFPDSELHDYYEEIIELPEEEAEEP